MEFYATVNGKPTKPCGKSFDLNDIEQRKKECLAEKRRQRILQVREQSKEFARKVRNDVAAEKERRQCKINEAKAREFQVWNTDTLARTHNYAACFGVPVGAAQYAAKLENEQRAALARMREQQQQRYCPHIGRPYNNSNRWPLRSCLKKHTTCTQTSPVQTEEVKAKKASPKRNKVYLNEFVCRCCVSDSDHEDLSDICEDISVSSLSDAELECETRKKGKQSGKQILCKTPAVVLALDIDPNDVVTITSPGEIKDKFTQNNRQFSSVIRVSPRTKTCGKSESCQCQPTCCYSEQESSATTLGTKSSKETSGTKGSTDTVGGAKGSSDTVGAKGSTDTSGPTDSTDTVGTKGSTDSTSTKSSTHTIDSDNSTKAFRQVEESSKLPVNKAMTTKSTSMTGLDNAKKAGAGRGSKRFRQVSDLLEKRANKATQMEENIQISKDTQTDCRPPPCAKIRGSKSRSITSAPKQNSKTYPQDEQEPSTSQPVQKPIDLTSERDCVQENISPKITTRSSLLKDKDAVRRSTDIVTFERAIENNDRQFSGKDAMSINSIPVDDCVQYYDYNNKYTKAYEQPSNAVRLQPLIRSEPNAMQRARLEKEQRSFRVEKMAQMRKQCEERGQKALEREQVRRDCTELTEKLEALSKHHVPLVPTDANIIGSHHFVDLAAKKQAKMNAIMEEMLMRPAIITCPEVSCPEIKCTDAKSTGTAKTRKTKSATCLNLGDTPPDNSDGSYPSSDSCRSILLGYVNDQSKQIRSDIDEYKTNPQRNEEKSKRLCNLLQRIEQLRDALRNEIESGGSSADVQNVKEVIDSISNVRKERERILIDNITEETIMPLQKREQKKAQRESSAQEKKRKETDNQKDKPSSSDLKAKLSDIKAKSSDIKSKSSNVNNAQDAECVAKINKPLEIVIKVAGAHIKRSGSSNVKKSSARSPRHKSKSPRKATKVIASSSVKKASKKPALPKKPYIQATEKNISSENVAVEASSIILEVNSDDSNISTNPTSNVVIHSSYDSNSTAYRSLPPKVSNNVDKVVEKIPSKTRQGKYN